MKFTTNFLVSAQCLKCFDCKNDYHSCKDPFNKTLALSDPYVYRTVAENDVCIKEVIKLGKGGEYVVC